MTTTLKYDEFGLEAIWLDGQWWVRGSQIVTPLGLAKYGGVQMVLQRHRAEFGPQETRMIWLPTKGGQQETRVFSLRGSRLLGLLVRTPQGAAFRAWALDVIEGRRPVPLPRMMRDQPALPGMWRVPAAMRAALDQIELVANDPEKVRAICVEFRSGQRAASAPGAEVFARRLEETRRQQAEVSRQQRAIERDARQAGISMGELREMMAPLRAAGMLAEKPRGPALDASDDTGPSEDDDAA